MSSPRAISRRRIFTTPAPDEKGALLRAELAGPTPCRGQNWPALSPEVASSSTVLQFDSPLDPFVARRALQHTPPPAKKSSKTIAPERFFAEASVQTDSLREDDAADTASGDDVSDPKVGSGGDWWEQDDDWEQDDHNPAHSPRQSCARRTRNSAGTLMWWLTRAAVMNVLLLPWIANQFADPTLVEKTTLCEPCKCSCVSDDTAPSQSLWSAATSANAPTIMDLGMSSDSFAASRRPNFVSMARQKTHQAEPRLEKLQSNTAASLGEAFERAGEPVMPISTTPTSATGPVVVAGDRPYGSAATHPVEDATPARSRPQSSSRESSYGQKERGRSPFKFVVGGLLTAVVAGGFWVI